MKRFFLCTALVSVSACTATSMTTGAAINKASFQALSDIGGVGRDAPIRYLTPVDARPLNPTWSDDKWKDEINRGQGGTNVYLLKVDDTTNVGVPVLGTSSITKGRWNVDFLVEKYINVPCQPSGTEGVGRVGVFARVTAYLDSNQKNFSLSPSFLPIAIEATKRRSKLRAQLSAMDSGLSGGTSETLTTLITSLGGDLTSGNAEKVMNALGAATAVLADDDVTYTPKLYAYQEKVPGACSGVRTAVAATPEMR